MHRSGHKRQWWKPVCVDLGEVTLACLWSWGGCCLVLVLLDCSKKKKKHHYPSRWPRIIQCKGFKFLLSHMVSAKADKSLYFCVIRDIPLKDENSFPQWQCFSCQWVSKGKEKLPLAECNTAALHLWVFSHKKFMNGEGPQTGFSFRMAT